jgi:hypothetical protein
VDMPLKTPKPPKYIIVDREDLINRLNTEILEIRFIKKSGEPRTLRGTTDLNRIPIEAHPKNGPVVNVLGSVLAHVYDLEANGWRSFDTTRITRVAKPRKKKA